MKSAPIDILKRLAWLLEGERRKRGARIYSKIARDAYLARLSLLTTHSGLDAGSRPAFNGETEESEKETGRAA